MRTLLRPLLLLALLAPAVSPPPARASEPAPAPAQAAPTDADRVLAERRAWASRVRELRAQERADLAQHAAELRSLPPGPSQAASQRALEDAKRTWRRRMLEAQLERATTAGQDAQASRLRARLADLNDLAARSHAPAVRGGGR
jgi:hypothetical protein